MPTLSDTKSRQVLSETPSRALVFLTAVSTTSSIRLALEPRGYTGDVHARFWQLLLRFAGFREGPSAPTLDERAREAGVEIALWEPPNFRIARAALKFDHPEVHDFVFNGLDGARGVGAIVSVATVLDRLDALEHDPERKKTRKTDHAALGKLASRGITSEERARLRRLYALATRSPELAPPAATSAPAEPMPEDERETTLRQLRAIYEEWAEIARVVIERRVDLIRLGLVKRRRAERGPGAKPIVTEKKSAPALAPEPAGAHAAELPLGAPLLHALPAAPASSLVAPASPAPHGNGTHAAPPVAAAPAMHGTPAAPSGATNGHGAQPLPVEAGAHPPAEEAPAVPPPGDPARPNGASHEADPGAPGAPSFLSQPS